jgi:hypothetical protein
VCFGIRSLLKGTREGDKIIAVIGPTGAGKSSFINFLSRNPVVIGGGLNPRKQGGQVTFLWLTILTDTNSISVHPCHHGEIGDYWLIDTPGFDDDRRSDAEILNDLLAMLVTAHHQEIKLTGIIYMHRISDARYGPTARRHLTAFQQLLGMRAMSQVTLVTTCWDLETPSQAQIRAQQLENQFWRPMIQEGSTMVRHHNTRASALSIVRSIVERDMERRQSEHLVPNRMYAGVREVVVDGRPMIDTRAAQVIQNDLQDAINRLERSNTELRRQFEEQMESNRNLLNQTLTQAEARERSTQLILRDARHREQSLRSQIEALGNDHADSRRLREDLDQLKRQNSRLRTEIQRGLQCAVM